MYQEAYHYQERQEAHLVKLKKEGAIEKVNPATGATASTRQPSTLAATWSSSRTRGGIR